MSKRGARDFACSTLTLLPRNRSTRNLARMRIMPRNRSGQVAIFIIIAIVIVSGVALFFVFKDKLGISASSSDPIYLSVRDCIEETGKDAILYITQNGGYLYSPARSTSGGIPYYYYKGKIYVPTEKFIETQISDYIEETISYCTEGLISNSSNKEISFGEMSARTTINSNSVVLSANYPVSVKIGDKVSRFESFNGIEIDSRIGVMYNTIQEIIEEEAKSDGVCLTCISDIIYDEDFTTDIVSVEDGIIFTLIDEHSKIKDVPVEWKFARD